MFLMGMILASTCGCGQITSGEVQSKEFVPEHEIEVDDPDITVSQDPLITIPGGSHMETVPDRWYITIGKEDEDGKWKTRRFCVDEAVYNQYGEGDWVDFGGD
jgi:hypothetical protein